MIYLPSICVCDSSLLDAIHAGTLPLQTGQWIHDAVSTGRVVRTRLGGQLIVWRAPGELYSRFLARFDRQVRENRALRQITEQLPLSPESVFEAPESPHETPLRSGAFFLRDLVRQAAKRLRGESVAVRHAAWREIWANKAYCEANYSFRSTYEVPRACH